MARNKLKRSVALSLVVFAAGCAEAPPSTDPQPPATTSVEEVSAKDIKPPPVVRAKVPAHLDEPFVPAEAGPDSAFRAKTPPRQPDQTPVPLTVGDLIKMKPCSTAMTSRLSAQLAAQMNCIKAGTFSRLDDIENLFLDQAANPFMQSAAVRSLRKVVQAHPDKTFHINSSWRSLVQQHVLKKWEGTCGIRVAADPGTSHHESGLAIDVPKEVTKTFRQTLKTRSWVWYCDDTNRGRFAGCRDAPHHTFKHGVDVRTLSVKAFQMLWNKANPKDRLPVSGFYGPMTAKRIAMAPLEGFASGTTCSKKLSFNRD